ncbi:DUF2019 domain-containing protein [Mesobacillus selenatarsenatis]|uniref:Uncharacterized protein n=1 Tax=Mesobacillus selenatarsenatis (strain DSM 18680 / JCM 14380 / FERM P-15431 / SF-1) TaxID=1321606 RepID=A0A0A8WXL0_MESS1|nr:DUF2019 domain-containing protein [Mesobacillus selenatarsenatis]GAM12363.1 hypothetical protein SAMD00020551_0496 [Mesobacillus selenatarsenatis SF-1]
MVIEQLLNKCIQSAIDYGIAAYEVVENYKKTNKLYDIHYKNFRLLKEQLNGVDALYQLLEHSNMYVRYIAAIHLLSVNEKTAKEVILSVGTLSESLKFDSKYLLQEWDNGNIKDYYS